MYLEAHVYHQMSKSQKTAYSNPMDTISCIHIYADFSFCCNVNGKFTRSFEQYCLRYSNYIEQLQLPWLLLNCNACASTISAEENFLVYIYCILCIRITAYIYCLSPIFSQSLLELCNTSTIVAW